MKKLFFRGALFSAPTIWLGLTSAALILSATTAAASGFSTYLECSPTEQACQADTFSMSFDNQSTSDQSLAKNAYPWTSEQNNLSSGVNLPCYLNLTSNPSVPVAQGDFANDQPFAMVSDGTSMYIAGFDEASGNQEWRIEKREWHTGHLVKGFFGEGIVDGVVVSNPTLFGGNQARGIAVDGKSIYIVGKDKSPANKQNPFDWQWRIEKRDKLDGKLDNIFGNAKGFVVSNPSNAEDIPFGIAIDNTFMYVVGYEYVKDGNFRWRIEKRDLVTGEFAPGFNDGSSQDGVIVSNPNSNAQIWNDAFAISIDAHFMYVVGYQDFDANGNGTAKWRIEKRSLVSGKLDPGFGQKGAVISSPGKFDAAAKAIAIDGNYMYVVGFDRNHMDPKIGNAQWRIEKRSLDDGSLENTKFGPPVMGGRTTGFITSNFGDQDAVANAIAIDVDHMYVVGFDGNPNDGTFFGEWRYEKISLTDGIILKNIGLHFSHLNDVATAVLVDQSCVRIAGWDSAPDQTKGQDTEWRMMGMLK